MDKKNIKFYKYDISTESDKGLDCLDNIEDENIQPLTINGKVIKIDSFRIKKFSNRFYGINIESGDLTHYSDVVVDTKDDLKVKNNPRKNTQIELDNQFLLLIDTLNNNIYISNPKKRSFVERQLTQKTDSVILIKEILDKKSFEQSLDTISEVNFLFSNMDLFNQSELNIALDEDKYNYGADSVRVVFNYKHRRFVGKVKERISKLMGENYKTMKVVGKDSSGLGAIFKPDSILNCIEIQSDRKENTRQVDYITVLSDLMIQIDANE